MKEVNRSWLYAIGGFILGLLAPVGWIIFRLILFWTPGVALLEQVVGDFTRSSESLALYGFMGLGTAIVLGAFGYFIGRASQQMHERATNLDRLNREIDLQKGEFERRFTELNRSIKNFHHINAKIQRSVDPPEVFRLTTDGLHEILNYDRVNILVVTPDRKSLKFAASRCGKESPLSEVTLPLDERAGSLFRAFRDRETVFVDDTRKMPRDYRLLPPFDNISQLRSRCFIICPVVVNDRVVGLLGVDNHERHQPLDDTDVDTVKLFSDQLGNALMRIDLLEGVEALTGQLAKTFSGLLGHRSDHAKLDGALKHATTSTMEAIAEISQAADVVQSAVDSTRSAAVEISASTSQVQQNISHFQEFMEKAIASMTEISHTVKSVEENGRRSYQMSETVRVRAEEGVSVVKNAQKGLQEIAVGVEATAAAVGQLCQKGEEIDTITAVINEITQKTNLLALNASIIAAQAGEQGRSFAVVADEVRNLSQEAASSTGAIGALIEEIQIHSQQTEVGISRTRKLVSEGITLGEGVGKALEEILDGAVSAMEMAHDISKANREVAQSAGYVTHSIEQLGEMATQIGYANGEQAQGTASIAKSMEEVKKMADEMVSATQRQLENTRDIDGAANSVSSMVERIFQEMDQRQKDSQELVENLERIKTARS